MTWGFSRLSLEEEYMLLKSVYRVALVLVAIGMVSVLHSSARATDVIQTLAGGGSLEGYKPGEANLALGNSQGLAISAIGELYVSDSVHNQVLKINPTTGRISIYAGNGTAAYFGDGTPATSAGLNSPGGLTFDSKGNLLIADRGNFVVRSVDAVTGLISTIAGNGLFTGQVIGSNPPAGLGDGGQATLATFSTMGDIAVMTSGEVIVADTGNACVRKFTVGGTIATIAGTAGTSGFTGDNAAATLARLSSPTGVVLDSSGNLYVADSGNRRIRKVDTAGTITTVAGSGGGNAGFNGDGNAATNAQIGSLGGIAFDSTGRLIITCVGAGRLRAVDLTASLIFTIAGGGSTLGDLGPATAASMTPRDIAIDSAGNTFVYDTGNGRIRRIDAKTQFIDTVVGTGVTGLIGDRNPKQFSVLVGPLGATFDASGNLYVADTGDNSIRKIATNGTVSTFAGNGNANGLGDGGPALLGNLSSPGDVLFVGSSIFVADTGHSRIRAVSLTSNGNIISTLAQVPSPSALVADASGLLYVTSNNQVLTVSSADGTINTFAGSTPKNTVANPLGDGLTAPNATLSNPSGLALGPAGDVYIADTGNNRIRLIRAGIVSTFAGGGTPTFPSVGDGGPALSASLNNPVGVTLDAAGTHLIVADSGNNRIRSIDLSTNVITTICGTGVAGFSGDGDVSATALVNNPTHIFVSSGTLVFADTNNNRIRQIVSAIDIDPKLLAFNAKLDFTVDKKTGLLGFGKDSVALKAQLALPAGIAAANLVISVDIIDLHQSIQLDAMGKTPKAAKIAKAATGGTPVFNFTLPAGGTPPVSKFALSLKGTSVAGGKPTSFSFASKGTFRDQLGRAGFTDTTNASKTIPVRVNITLGKTVFTGLTNVLYKSTQGKNGSAASVKTK